MITKLLTTAFLLLTSTQAYSYNGWMNIHLGSYHLKPNYEENGKSHLYNQANFGMGLSLPVTYSIDALTGFYENSYNKTSVYVGINYHIPNNYGFSAGINSGIVSGYEDTINTDSKLVLMLVPHITYAFKNIRMEIGYAPSFGAENRSSVIIFSVGNRF